MKKAFKKRRETVLRDRYTERVLEGKERIPVINIGLLTKLHPSVTRGSLFLCLQCGRPGFDPCSLVGYSP